MGANSTFSKASLISLFCHFFVLMNIAFIFHPQYISQKPLFVFLGSFLSPRDFLPNPATRFTPYTKFKTEGIDFNKQKILRKSPFSSDVVKPIFLEAKETGFKKQFKPAEKELIDINRIKRQVLEDLGIVIENPAYVPLKLYEE